MLLYHIVHKDMDLDILFEYKPALMDIHHPFCNQLNIQIDNTNQNLTFYEKMLLLLSYALHKSCKDLLHNQDGKHKGLDVW